jgi:SAM-dependent methyltransferase
MSLPRLYADLAWLWPLLSPPADYAAEAATIRRVLEERLGFSSPEARHRLLEFGAGGGHTLYHLAEGYDCVAVDLSAQMLTNCRMLNPQVRCEQGDMRSLRLGETFDAVLIHDAIDYLTCEDDLRATFATAAAHLRPGGLLLVAPTYTAETFHDHQTASDQQSHGPIVLTYVSYIHDPDPNDTTFEMVLVYVLNERGRVEVIEDRHTCGLFAESTWTHLLREAGFQVEASSEEGCHGEPYELFVATRQQPR